VGQTTNVLLPDAHIQTRRTSSLQTTSTICLVQHLPG
jgi:hypothetical protein